MAYQLAQAYVQIVPSMKGVGKAIEGAFAGPAKTTGGKAGKTAGGAFSAGFGMKMGAVAGVAGTVASTVINAFSGLSGEILNASDSTQKFQQTLGFAKLSDGDIKRLTASTQDYANKTVYGIDDIRNTTAQLAANGVPNYDKLAEAAGNLNAVAGGNAETYKSVAMMLTQTAGAGKLTTENWNQLADAIPGASGKLQEAMRANGAFTGNFRDAMEKGEITADEFNQALMQLGMDDVAQKAAESTSTFEGAFGNLQATITDGAANIVNTVKPYITGFVTDLGNGIGTAMQWVNDFMGTLMQSQGVQTFANGVRSIAGAIGAIVTPFAGLVGSMLGFTGGADSAGGAAQRFSDILGIAGGVLQSVGTFIQQNTQWLLPLVAAIMGGVTAFQLWNGAISLWQTATKIATGVQTAFNMVMNANPIMLVVTAIGALAAGLAYFFTQTETGRQLWQTFVTWIQQAWTSISTAAQQIWGSLTGFFSNLWNGISTTVTSVWNGISTFFTNIFTTISNAFTTAWNAISGFVGGVMNGIRTVIGTVWTLIGGGIVIVLQNIRNVINTVFTWVLNFIRDRMNSTSGIWKTAWTAIYTLVSTVWKLIGGVVSTAINAVRTVVVTVVKLLQGDWQGAWDTIKEFASGIWDGIKTVVGNAIDAVRTVIGNVMDAVKGAWERVWDAVSSFLGPIWDGIRNTVSNAIDAVKSTVSNVLDGIKDVWDNIWGGIRDALGGIWDGITSAVGNGIQNVANTVGGIKDTVLGAVSGAGRWLYDVGSQLISGLWDGVSGALGGLYNKIKDGLSGMVDAAKDALGIHSPSRVFRDQIGRQILPGVQSGIDMGQTAAERSMSASMQELADRARDALNGVGRETAARLTDEIQSTLRARLASVGAGFADELNARVRARLSAVMDEMRAVQASMSYRMVDAAHESAGILRRAQENTFNVYANDPRLVAAQVMSRMRRAGGEI